MQPARCFPVPVVLLLSTLLFPVMAAGAADAATPAPDGGVWLLLIITGVIAIVVAALVLVYSFRLMKIFGESISSLIDTLRALTPMPLVTLSDEILNGVEGRLEVRVTGLSSLPLEVVTVILAPPPDLVLEDDHITLPRLDAGETKIFRISHGPARKGKYPVRITVLYHVGEEVRVREFARIVCAGIQAGPETTD
jgi:hypothetical protein